jgi:hypothetical protein
MTSLTIDLNQCLCAVVMLISAECMHLLLTHMTTLAMPFINCIKHILILDNNSSTTCIFTFFPTMDSPTTPIWQLNVLYPKCAHPLVPILVHLTKLFHCTIMFRIINTLQPHVKFPVMKDKNNMLNLSFRATYSVI